MNELKYPGFGTVYVTKADGSIHLTISSIILKDKDAILLFCQNFPKDYVAALNGTL